MSSSTDRTQQIEQFCSITGADKNVAKSLLEACNGNLELAIEMHMDGGATATESTEQSDQGATTDNRASTSRVPQMSSQSEIGEDVRAPIPQRNETLVEDVPAFVLRGRRRQARSVFDGFRDFQAEARQQEQMLTLGSNVSFKKRTLEDLFRPPIDITYKGTFANAREAGTSQNKYLMVNVQNVKEFVCQALNRDVWSNSSVKAVLKNHFIFWQVYHDSEEGSKFTQFYKVNDYPYVAIIDPRTGENMATWNKLDAICFCDLVTEFLSEHPYSEDSMTESPPSKKCKRESSVVDLSEDDQIQAAIQASLQASKPRTAVVIDSDSDEDDIETFSDREDDYQPSPVKQNSVPKISHSKFQNIESSFSTSDKLSDSHQCDAVNSSTSTVSVEKDCKKISESDCKNGTIQSSMCKNNSESDSKSSYKQYLGSDSDPQTTLMIRFPDGKRQQLSISCNSKLMALVMFVADHGYSNERYELITNFPRRKLSYMDFDLTIQEAGLNAQESIFVQAR